MKDVSKGMEEWSCHLQKWLGLEDELPLRGKKSVKQNSQA